MTYNPNIPTAGSAPATSVDPIRVNFQTLDTVLNQDHVAPSAASNRCLHRRITLVNTAAPGAQVNPQSVVYSKNVTVGAETKPQLFYRNSGGEKQITSAQVNRPTWPYWAFGRASVDDGVPTLVDGSFQVASVVRHPSSGNIQGWTVTMSTAAPNSNYLVLATAEATSPLTSAEGYDLIYQIVSTTQFRLSYRDQSGGRRPTQLSGFSFSVLVN